jgi:hypothetical protein
VGLALILTSGSALAACGSGPSGPSAQSVLTLATKDASAQKWVHEVRVESAPGYSLKGANFIGLTSESQKIVVNGSHAAIIVLPDTAYVKGDKTAITSFFGIKTKHPATLAGKWIAIKSSNAAYATLSAAATLVKHFAEYTVIGPLSEGSDVTIDGQKALPISGHIAGQNKTSIKATMYVTTSGVVLPIELLIKEGTAISTTTWSGWGHAVKILAPATSVPFSIVSG